MTQHSGGDNNQEINASEGTTGEPEHEGGNYGATEWSDNRGSSLKEGPRRAGIFYYNILLVTRFLGQKETIEAIYPSWRANRLQAIVTYARVRANDTKGIHTPDMSS